MILVFVFFLVPGMIQNPFIHFKVSPKSGDSGIVGEEEEGLEEEKKEEEEK